MICPNCRKQNRDTQWEKLGKFLMKYVFPTILADIRADFYTQGINQGYKLGFESGSNIQKKLNNPDLSVLNEEL